MNKQLPYCDIVMRCDMLPNLTIHPLPENYRFKSYEDGDEQHWASLETEVSEFSAIEDALDYFNRTFLPFKEMLYDRMFFILDDHGNYVATTTAWFKDDEKRHYALLHWVSVSPNQQGKGLGKCIVSYALSQFYKLESKEKEIFLHTQTWSYKAIVLYKQYGFKISRIPLAGCHTNMECINVLKEVLHEELMDNLVEQ